MKEAHELRNITYEAENGCLIRFDLNGTEITIKPSDPCYRALYQDLEWQRLINASAVCLEKFSRRIKERRFPSKKRMYDFFIECMQNAGEQYNDKL